MSVKSMRARASAACDDHAKFRCASHIKCITSNDNVAEDEDVDVDAVPALFSIADATRPATTTTTICVMSFLWLHASVAHAFYMIYTNVFVHVCHSCVHMFIYLCPSSTWMDCVWDSGLSIFTGTRGCLSVISTNTCIVISTNICSIHSSSVHILYLHFFWDAPCTHQSDNFLRNAFWCWYANSNTFVLIYTSLSRARRGRRLILYIFLQVRYIIKLCFLKKHIMAHI